MELSISTDYLSAFEVQVTLDIKGDNGLRDRIRFVTSSEIAHVLVPTIRAGVSMWNAGELKLVESDSTSHSAAFTKGA